MRLWTIVEEKRLAALAAKAEHWRVLERHRWKSHHGHQDLLKRVDNLRLETIVAESQYVIAQRAAIESGEPHPGIDDVDDLISNV